MVLDAFGPNRLMWGSDWPIVTAHLAYGEWLRRSMELAAELSESERARLFGETAAEAYLGDMTGSGTPHGRKWLDARPRIAGAAGNVIYYEATTLFDHVACMIEKDLVAV